MRFFWMWLWESWKFEVNVLLISPFALLFAICLIISDILRNGAELLAELCPERFKPSYDGMRKVVIATKEWEKQNDNK